MLPLRVKGAALALVLLVGAEVRALGETLYSDTFDGAGRPSGWLTFNAPSERFWTVFDGEFLTGNGDEITAEGGYSYAVATAQGSESWGNYTVSADVWMSQRNGRIGLVGHWKSPQEHIEGSIELNEGRRTARIIRASLGLLGAIPQRETLAQGEAQADKLAIPAMEGGTSKRDAHRLALSFRNSEIALMIDGQVVLRAEDSQLKAGTAGLANYQSFAYYDDFRVDGVEEEAPAAPTARPARPAARPRPTLPESPGAPSGPSASAVSEAASQPVSAGAARPVPRGTVAMPNIRGEVPLGVFENLDLDELAKRLTSEEQAIYKSLSAEERVNLLKTIAVELRRATSPQDTQLAADLEKVKRQLEKLTSDQERLAESLSQKALEERSVAEGIQQIDKAQDRRDYAAALSKANDLIQQYPNNATLTAKKKQLERLSAGTYEGYEEALDKNQAKYQQMEAEAKRLEQEGSLQSAQAAWMTVLALTPSRPEWIDAASAALGSLNGRVAAEASALRGLRLSAQRERWIIYSAGGGAFLLIVLVLAVLRRHSKRVKARDQQILAQVKDLTRPIMDMQEEIRHLTGATALFLPEAPKSAESTPAGARRAKAEREESGGTTETLPRARPLRASKPAPAEEEKPKGLEDLFPTDLEAPSEPAQELADTGLGLEEDLPKAGVGAKEESDTWAAFDSALDVSLDQGLEELMTPVGAEPTTELAPSQASAEREKPERGSAKAAEEKEPAEPESMAPEDWNAPLDLGLEDLISAGPAETEGAAEGKTKKSKPAGAGDESREKQEEAWTGAAEDLTAPQELPGPDLLDFATDFPEDSEAKTAVPEFQPAPEEEELSQILSAQPEGFVFDFPELEDVAAGAGKERQGRGDGADEPGRMAVPGPGAEGAGAPAEAERGVLLAQSFDDEPVGASPTHWSGQRRDDVVFEISDVNPAPNSTRCLRYLKTSGTDSVYFSRSFPRVNGVVSVEFDICCPKKNKYLLGVYVERDSDYNQAVRTVIHCIDPTAASLRMQNEPAPYKMGEWRHVKYVINLYEGKIDGYLDGRAILDQQVFVNKPPFVNTISIRDNHATTGELLLDNLKVERLG